MYAQAVCLWVLTFIATSPDYSETILIIVFALFGLFSAPCIPFAMELCVECTYPIQTGISFGFMLLVMQLAASFFSWGQYYLTEDKTDEFYQAQDFNSTCDISDTSDALPQDFRGGLIFVSAMFTGILVVSSLILRVPWLRRRANQEGGNKGYENKAVGSSEMEEDL